MDVGIVSWHRGNFEKSFPVVSSLGWNGKKIIVCQKKELEAYRQLAGGDSSLLLTPETCAGIFGFASDQTIGHCRNLALLASSIISPESPVVFFDDDVFPSASTLAAFESSFKKYGLVQGQYSGDEANSLYLAVHFFGLLEKACEGGDEGENFALVRECLRGKFDDGDSPPSSLKGASGGVLGISAQLKTLQCFAPTSYRIEDHFYEFGSRIELRSVKFMDAKASPEEIPQARHIRGQGDSGTLVSAYSFELKSSVVEKYLIFRRFGAVPKIVNGAQALLKLPSFDPEEMAYQAAEEGALAKMQSAAGHYLSKDPPEEIANQLKRFLSLSASDFFVPQEELESEYARFIEEKKNFGRIVSSTDSEKEKMGKELIGAGKTI